MGRMGNARKKKRQRRNDETTGVEERKSKKRKKVESITAAPTSEPTEAGASCSASPAPETIAAARKPHRRGRPHRARFIASKRLATTSSVAVAEILGISSSSVTPPSVSRVATPEVTPEVEDGEHSHFKVSSKSVADYFKDKMRAVISKPRYSETETDEAPRGGIGSRPTFRGREEVEEDDGLCGGFSRGLLSKMSAAKTFAETFVQGETPKREGKGKRKEERKCRSGNGEGEVNHKKGKTNKTKELTPSG